MNKANFEDVIYRMIKDCNPDFYQFMKDNDSFLQKIYDSFDFYYLYMKILSEKNIDFLDFCLDNQYDFSYNNYQALKNLIDNKQYDILKRMMKFVPSEERKIILDKISSSILDRNEKESVLLDLL